MKNLNSEADDGPIDYQFWMRTAYWTVEEGAALVLGVNPSHMKDGAYAENGCSYSSDDRLSQLIELGKRAQFVKRLPEKPSPPEYLEWIMAMDIVQIPSVFENDNPESNLRLRKEETLGIFWNSPFTFIDYKLSFEGLEQAYYHVRNILKELELEHWELQDSVPNEEQSDKSRVSFDDRKRKTMLKILLSLAVEKYHFNPTMERSSVPKNIESATQRCGLEVTDETIRSYLKEAVAEFPSIRNLFA